MSEHHARFRVRYYPHEGDWTLYVQRVDAEGMPMSDVLSAHGHSKADARLQALADTADPEIRQAIENSAND